MNYWIIKAQLTAAALDAAHTDLLKAMRQSSPRENELQRAWDLLADEMSQLNKIVKRRRSTY